MELFIFWLIMAGVVAIIAGHKGFNWFGWGLYGFLIWPIALVHVLVKDRHTHRPIPVVITQGVTAAPVGYVPPAPMPVTSYPPTATKICPMCAERVQAAARICRFCRHEFEGPVLDASSAPAAGRQAQLPATGHVPFGMRKCPACQELNWHDARNCKHCGVNLPPRNTG